MLTDHARRKLEQQRDGLLAERRGSHPSGPRRFGLTEPGLDRIARTLPPD